MRIENWDVALVDYAESQRGREFVWGRTDCATLSRRGLTIILGANPLPEFLPPYDTKREALGLVKAVDFDLYPDVLRDSGAVEVGPKFATAGDLAIGPELDKHGLYAMSILVPARKVLYSTQESGVTIIDKLNLPEGTRFWRYG